MRQHGLYGFGRRLLEPPSASPADPRRVGPVGGLRPRRGSQEAASKQEELPSGKGKARPHVVPPRRAGALPTSPGAPCGREDSPALRAGAGCSVAERQLCDCVLISSLFPSRWRFERPETPKGAQAETNPIPVTPCDTL